MSRLWLSLRRLGTKGGACMVGIDCTRAEMKRRDEPGQGRLKYTINAARRHTKRTNDAVRRPPRLNPMQRANTSANQKRPTKEWREEGESDKARRSEARSGSKLPRHRPPPPPPPVPPPALSSRFASTFAVADVAGGFEDAPVAAGGAGIGIGSSS